MIRCVADSPRTTDSGIIYYRGRKGTANRLFRYKLDGTREQVGDVPINEMGSASPDGKWVFAWTQYPTDPNHSGNFAINTQDGSVVAPCPGCDAGWTSNGRYLVVFTDPLLKRTTSSVRADVKTLVVALKPGEDLPKIPPGGWQSAIPKASRVTSSTSSMT